MCCIICEEDSSRFVVLHKTRKKIHCVCEECFIGYVSPIFKKKIELFRTLNNPNNIVKYINCCGLVSGCERNRCKKKIEITSLNIDQKCPIYDDFIRLKLLLTNNKYHICMNSTCGNIIEVSERYHNKLECIECKIDWCQKCKVSPYHNGYTCLEYELIEEKTENAKYIKKQIDEKKIQLCGTCRAPVYRISGCNHMTCTRCSKEWCWLCGKIIIGESHFFEAGACYRRMMA